MRPLTCAALLCCGAVAAVVTGCATTPPPRDQACLAQMRARGIRFEEEKAVKGVRTPVTVNGAAFVVRLQPRGDRPPTMDCQLALALHQAAPVFRRAGISELEYSAAYHFRNRRGSSQLSKHAAGLAIDVHVFRGHRREYVVARNFERRPRAWRALRPGSGAYAACVGRTRTQAGRTLRGLACQLKLDETFRVIITPDDDRDHHDHFHIEAEPDVARRLDRVPRNDLGARLSIDTPRRRPRRRRRRRRRWSPPATGA